MAHDSSTTSGGGYGSLPLSYSTSQGESLMQRSVSSHTLDEKKMNNNGVHGFMSVNDFLDVHVGSIPRVFRPAELLRINEGRYGQRSGSPLLSECSFIIEGMMNSACPYSPEEKKERIERYKSKRSQRNFNKRIKYECRKNLANSRPRVRGRFTRNEAIEKNPQVQLNHFTREEDEEDGNLINYLNSVSAANLFSSFSKV